MIFFGKKEALDFIAKWEPTLSPTFAKSWNDFKQRRDIVAKRMGLNEKEIINVTVCNLADCVVWDLKTKHNLIGDKQKILSTHGNTEIIAMGAKVARDYKEYREKCSYFIELFEKEMDKLKNNKR